MKPARHRPRRAAARRAPAGLLEAVHVRHLPRRPPGPAGHHGADRERHQRAARSRPYLRGVVPAEMPSSWPAEALRAQAIAARSYAARRLRPGESYVRRQRRHALAGLPRPARRERRRPMRPSRRRPAPCSRAGRRSPTRCSTRPAAARPRTTRTSSCRRPAPMVAGPVSYLRGVADRAPDGSAYDAASPYATW